MQSTECTWPHPFVLSYPVIAWCWDSWSLGAGMWVKLASLWGGIPQVTGGWKPPADWLRPACATERACCWTTPVKGITFRLKSVEFYLFLLKKKCSVVDWQCQCFSYLYDISVCTKVFLFPRVCNVKQRVQRKIQAGCCKIELTVRTAYNCLNVKDWSGQFPGARLHTLSLVFLLWISVFVTSGGLGCLQTFRPPVINLPVSAAAAAAAVVVERCWPLWELPLRPSGPSLLFLRVWSCELCKQAALSPL